MEFVKEFKAFATRGNVVDMAVGIIIGTAFGKIVTSLVNDIIMPPIGLLLGGMSFNRFKFFLSQQDNVAISYGAFLATVVDFMVVALVIFLLIRGFNRLRPQAAKTTKACPECLSLIPLEARRCAHCTASLVGGATA